MSPPMLRSALRLRRSPLDDARIVRLADEAEPASGVVREAVRPGNRDRPWWPSGRGNARVPRSGSSLTDSQLERLLNEIAVCREGAPHWMHEPCPVVRAWRDYAPEFVPLPHPSPRSNLRLRKHP